MIKCVGSQQFSVAIAADLCDRLLPYLNGVRERSHRLRSEENAGEMQGAVGKTCKVSHYI